MRRSHYCKMSVLLCLLCGGPGFHINAADETEAVIPSFNNVLINSNSNPEPEVSTSLTLFSGNVGPYAAPGADLEPAIPTAADSGITLSRSAIAQTFSTGVPYLGYVEEFVVQGQELLYPDAGLNREQTAASGKAFRYKPLLFSNNGEGAIGSDFEKIGDWYDAEDRTKALAAIGIMAQALRFGAQDPTLRNAMLDAYYDLAVAEVQYVKILQGSLSEWRLGFLSAPSGGFIINEEINLQKEILEKYEYILGEYGDFLGQRFSQNVNQIDSATQKGLPTGAWIFREEQPVRNQNAMSFLDEDGVLKTVPKYNPESEETEIPEGGRTLLSGYKDYALILTLLRDYGKSAAELARLYGLRRLNDGENNDYQTGLQLIAKVQQELLVTLSLLNGILPDYRPVIADGTGIAETMNGIQVARADLNNAQSFLLGEANALGFDPDFLVLIQEFPDSTEGNQFDSYDAMIRWIRNTGTSPLNFAESAYDTAFLNYEKYKGFADQVFNELSGINTTMSQRYFEITGYDPEEDGDHRNDPKQGSELWLIESTIEQLEEKAAQLIELDTALDEGFERAAESVGVAQGLKQGIEDATAAYKGTITTQRNKITSASATQAGVQATYDTASDIASMSKADDLLLGGAWGVGVTAVVGAANIATQIITENIKGNAERELDLAAADYEAELEKNDTELVVNQAIENRDSLEREMISNTLQTIDNQTMLSQELSRKAAAYRELDRLINNRESTVGGLADRYYADPVHFLRSQNDMIKADNAFREAQEWVFYTTRALEFKWNKDFIITYLDKDWSLETLYKLRNFLELEEMVAALEQFNTVNLVGFNREEFVDKISLKNDILAPYPGIGPDDGMRYDFETDETVTATELMRRKLDRNRDEDGNIVIRINTFALEINDGFFFLGPDYRSDGSVLSAGKYLDKIDWVKLNAVTTEATDVVRTAILSYAGTCYIRNRVPPCYDLDNPFELGGEFRRFPFRYFYTLDNGVNWLTRQDQQDTVKMYLSGNATEPEKGVNNSTLENNFLKERSVAATDIIITIPKNNMDIGQLEDLEVYINHLFVSREVPSCN